MNDFFVLNNASEIPVGDDFSGYVLFYKKSGDEKVAAIQLTLMQRLIENGLKLKLSNFLLIDIQQAKTRLATLIKSRPVKKVFLFGIKESEVGINFDIPMYKSITVSSIEFLRSDAPEVLEQDKSLKNKLWEQLLLSFKLT